ncbi:MAG: hypothetical protein JEY96_19465 [Bacteroidales bacterium]|nr:hypothetical protein [Bacteroidales bacterium]
MAKNSQPILARDLKKSTKLISMENSFSKKMQNKSDQELIEVIENREKFQQAAFIAAVWELEKREKAETKYIKLKDEMLIKQEQQVNESANKAFVIPEDLPKQIRMAAYLLFGTILIGIINSVLYNYFTNGEAYATSYSIFILIFSLSIMTFFSYMILLGRNWARITILVLFLLGAVLGIPTLIYYFNLSPIIGLISLIQTGLQIYALILLYNKESKNWYLKQKTEVKTA